MSNQTWTVYVPDRTAPLTGIPGSLTAEEVRGAVAGSGHTSVQTAEMTVNETTKTITFRRPTGGTKGL